LVISIYSCTNFASLASFWCILFRMYLAYLYVQLLQERTGIQLFVVRFGKSAGTFHVLLNIRMVAELEGRTPLSPNPIIGHVPGPSPSMSVTSILMLSYHLLLSLLIGRFPTGFHTKIPYHSLSPSLLHAQPTVTSYTSLP